MPPRKRAVLTTLSDQTPVMDGLLGEGPLPSQATWNAMMKSVESKAKRPRKRKPRKRKEKKSSKLLFTKDRFALKPRKARKRQPKEKIVMSLEQVLENLPLSVLQKTAQITRQTSLGSFVRKIGRATQKVIPRK